MLRNNKAASATTVPTASFSGHETHDDGDDDTSVSLPKHDELHAAEEIYMQAIVETTTTKNATNPTTAASTAASAASLDSSFLQSAASCLEDTRSSAVSDDDDDDDLSNSSSGGDAQDDDDDSDRLLESLQTTKLPAMPDEQDRKRFVVSSERKEYASFIAAADWRPGPFLSHSLSTIYMHS